MKTINYFSMFSGIGGFELGLEAAGKLTGTNFNCIGYSEIDKHAITTYEEHFNHDNYGDATAIQASDIRRPDLLVAGFPCQSFSIAGKRGGFEDTRGTLFFDIARILEHHKPKHFILENVKGLLSHAGGRTFRTIIETLVELGYGVEWQVLNSKNHGVPQSRERVYIVGHFGGPPTRAILPGPCSSHPDAVGKPAPHAGIGVIDASEGVGANSAVFPFTHESPISLSEVTSAKSMSQRVYEPTISPVLTACGSTGGPQLPKFRDFGPGGEVRIRRLTITEAERLQGFPDGWTVGGDTQRYKQCGNAVTVNVVRDIAQRLYQAPSH